MPRLASRPRPGLSWRGPAWLCGMLWREVPGGFRGSARELEAEAGGALKGQMDARKTVDGCEIHFAATVLPKIQAVLLVALLVIYLQRIHPGSLHSILEEVHSQAPPFGPLSPTDTFWSLGGRTESKVHRGSN